MHTKDFIELKLHQGPKALSGPLRERFSPRWFDGVPVSKHDLHQIMEAARWAPSSMNSQPWFYYVVNKGTTAFTKVCALLQDSNAVWGETAGTLIVACSEGESSDGIASYTQLDLGCSVMSLVIEAHTLGYYTRMMGGFNRQDTQRVLDLPENHKPVVIIALGSIGDYETIDPGIEEKEKEPRERKRIIYLTL